MTDSRSRDKERRLESLRCQAREHGRVEDPGVRPAGSPFPVASAEAGYYGTPLLKEPTWTWEIPLYFFVGGMAGASAVVASAARVAGAESGLARDARWIAALGGAASPPLLVSDLGRPARFLNMLRVFKLQSPMSVGAWTLLAFSSSASASAFADLLSRRAKKRVPVRLVTDAAQVLSAATGLVMSSYTGVLIGATTIPVWSRNVSVLPVEFTASALGSAVSALELLGHRAGALSILGTAASVTETVTGVLHERTRDPALEPAKKGRGGLLIRAGGVLSGPAALILRLLGRRREAAALTLTGSLLLRYGWLEAGRASAKDAKIPLELAPKPNGGAPDRLATHPSA